MGNFCKIDKKQNLMKKLIILSLITLALITPLFGQQKTKQQKVYIYNELLVFFKTEKDQKNVLTNVLTTIKKEGINFSDLKLEKKSDNLFLISSKKDFPKIDFSQPELIVSPNYEVIFDRDDFKICTPCPNPRTAKEIDKIKGSRRRIIASYGIEDFPQNPTGGPECRDCECCPKVHTTNYFGVNKHGSNNFNFAEYIAVNIDIINSDEIKVIIDPFELKLNAAESEIMKTLYAMQIAKGKVKFKEVKY